MTRLAANPIHRLAIAHLRAAGYFVSLPPQPPGINMRYMPRRGSSEARTVDYTNVNAGNTIIAYRTCSHRASCRLSTWTRWVTRTRAKRETSL